MTAPSGSTDARRFHVLDRIGSGGFGDVYKATLISGGGVERTVAIKVLHKDLAPNSQALERLRDEGKMLGLLQHPAIVRVLDLVELDRRAALVTEYIEGADLGLCYRRGALGPRALLQICAQVASALDAAFNQTLPSGEPLKLVHRDVKPENIRVGRHGDVKLLDFGIAKAGGFAREARTAAGDVIGSYRYMAPERLARSMPDAPECDVYSLGAVLYEGLANERLFKGVDLRAQVGLAGDAGMHQLFVQKRVTALDGTSPVLSNLLLASLAHDPRQRPKAAKLAALMDDLADAQPGHNLRKWARNWDWPPEDAAPGPLTGKTVREASQPPSASRPRRTNITLMTFDDPPSKPPGAGSNSSAPPAAKKKRTGKQGGDPRTSERPKSQKLYVPRSQQDTAPVSVDPVAAKAKAASSKSGSRGGAGRLAGVAVVLLGVFGLAMSAGILGGVGWFVYQDAAPEPQAPEVEEPLSLSEAEPEPGAAPPATEPEPQPEPELEPEPDGGTPAPQPAPVPEPVEPDEPGSLVVEGKVPVQLRQGADGVGPGPVPVGDYALYADFGEGYKRASNEVVTVASGTSVNVKCSSLKLTCELDVATPVPDEGGEGEGG